MALHICQLDMIGESRPRVSVIVPVYNKQDYVEQCLDSVLTQTASDLELIVVDDGSTDASRAICERFANRDSRVRLITQPNAGHSAARNAGIERATGYFVMFVDADDYLSRNDALTILLERSDKDGCDVVLSDLTAQLDEKQDYPSLPGREALQWLLESRIYHASMCSRLFSLPLVQSNPFKDLISDDEEWTPRVLLGARQVGIVPVNIYSRRILATSVTGDSSQQNCLRKARDRISTTHDLLSLYEGRGIDDPTLVAHATSIFFGSIYLYSFCLRGNVGMRRELLAHLELNDSTIPLYASSSKFSHRIFCRLSSLGGARRAFQATSMALRVVGSAGTFSEYLLRLGRRAVGDSHCQ